MPQEGLTKATVADGVCSWQPISDAIGLKLCLHYSYKNATSVPSAPIFPLAGPANFDVYVQKSDPTANVYLFEYKWSQGRDSSVISLTFDTPGSTVKRLMHANFTIDKTSNNLTMLMESSSGVILARGRIKNTDDQKIFQVIKLV